MLIFTLILAQATAQPLAVPPVKPAEKLRCHSTAETGNLAKVRRVCHTAAEWDRIARDARAQGESYQQPGSPERRN